MRGTYANMLIVVYTVCIELRLFCSLVSYVSELNIFNTGLILCIETQPLAELVKFVQLAETWKLE